MPVRAAIIAGGLGTRAHRMTGDRIPKALLPVAGTPIVFRQLRLLAREGVREVLICAGHHGLQLREGVRPEAERLGLRIEVVVEERPLGTAGCLGAARDWLAGSDVLVVYGDVVFDVALDRLLDFHRKSCALATIAAHPNDHPQSSDLLVTNDDGRVRAVLHHASRPPGDYRNLVPAGLYALAPGFLAHIPDATQSDFVRDVFPQVIARGEPIYAYRTPEYLRDMGSEGRHSAAASDLESGRVESLNARRQRPAVFLDCDGVLNREPGGHGVLSPDAVELLPGAARAVARVNAAGWLAVAITNRPQRAKGLLSAEGLEAILGRLENELAREGAILDRIYHCPHHPERGFPGEVPELKVPCACRKPAPGLLREAARELPVQLERSVMIGDSWRDVGAAHALGIPAYGVRTGAGCRELQGDAPPDLVFADVAEAVDFALGYRERSAAALALARATSRAPWILAVCGRARAGKSALAHACERALREDGKRVVRVSLDDWIVPLSERLPGMDALARNRVGEYAQVVARLRAGETVAAPGYDPHSRAAGKRRTYSAAGAEVLILEGIFAGHASLRDRVDAIVFVECDDALLRQRFRDFYRWKGLCEPDIDSLLEERVAQEWPLVDAQRDAADLAMTWS